VERILFIAAIKQCQMTVRYNELLKDAKQRDSGRKSSNTSGLKRNYRLTIGDSAEIITEGISILQRGK
jgi:hypothetical protein